MVPHHKIAKVLFYRDTYELGQCTHIDMVQQPLGGGLRTGKDKPLRSVAGPLSSCHSFGLVPRSMVAASILSQKAYFPHLCH